MAWSTSQLAELAGTTVKAVRHYHKVGLLDLPERKTNGYKQYEVAHLLRLLQITRLAELGVPLAQVAALGGTGGDPTEAITVLDSELEASVERLQRIRMELALILRHRAPADLPVSFSGVADALTEADRSLLMIYSRVFDDSALTEVRHLIQNEPPNDGSEEFQVLAADADLATRRRLGEQLAPLMSRVLEEYPALANPTPRARRGALIAQNTVVAALNDLYNTAQLEVLYRSHLISTGSTEELAALESTLDIDEIELTDRGATVVG